MKVLLLQLLNILAYTIIFLTIISEISPKTKDNIVTTLARAMIAFSSIFIIYKSYAFNSWFVVIGTIILTIIVVPWFITLWRICIKNYLVYLMKITRKYL